MRTWHVKLEPFSPPIFLSGAQIDRLGNKPPLHPKWHYVLFIVHFFWPETYGHWSKVVHYKGNRVPFGTDTRLSVSVRRGVVPGLPSTPVSPGWLEVVVGGNVCQTLRSDRETRLWRPERDRAAHGETRGVYSADGQERGTGTQCRERWRWTHFISMGGLNWKRCVLSNTFNSVLSSMKD